MPVVIRDREGANEWQAATDTLKMILRKTPLANLTKLNTLYLESTRISDLLPLVANSGLGDGDHVYLQDIWPVRWKTQKIWKISDSQRREECKFIAQPSE